MAKESGSSLTERQPSRASSSLMPDAGGFLWLAQIAILAIFYFASAKLGLSLAFLAEQISAVWPPSGIALAAILLGGYRLWPGIALGAFAANYSADEPFFTACGIALGNTLEAVVGSWLLTRNTGFCNDLGKVRDVINLIILAACVSSILSATIGVTSLLLGGVELPALQRPIQWSDFESLWWVWWIGDAMGMLVVAPPLLTSFSIRAWNRPFVSELAILLVALVVTCSLIFVEGLTSDLGQASLAYLVFPYVIWAGLRLDQRATAYVVLASSCLMICATLSGNGPFGSGPPHERLVLLQVFIGVVAISALLLASALAERRRVEHDIARSGESYRVAVEELQTLVDISPVGIFIAGDPQCNVITANPAGAAMLQIPADANSSKTGTDPAMLPFKIAHDGEPVPDEDLPMQRAVRTGLSVVGEEFEVTRGDGSVVTLLEYASPLFDALGKVRGCLGVFVDITDRKQMEQALKALDRRKDEFLATLAHELRNPLSPVRTGIDLMKIMDRDDPEYAEVLGTMDRQVSHLTRLVDDLLDVSRVTRGKVQLHFELIDVAVAIKSAVESNQPLIDECSHELTVSVPSAPLYVRGDLTRLAQIFGNLLNNAAKYTERGGKIFISAEQRGKQIKICVKDTGEGIEADMLPRVFELFTQGPRSLDRSQGGLGIGLTLVEQLVQMHGGAVEAHSPGVGLGSEFVVQLPCAEEGAAVSQSTSSEQAASGPCRVLVVDDNQDAARTLALILKKDGHEVHVAHSGHQALDCLASFCPQMLLLDIGMPEMDGYEIASHIRRERMFDEIVLVAVTGWGQAEDRERAISAGFDHHLTKPVEYSALAALIASHVSKMHRTTVSSESPKK